MIPTRFVFILLASTVVTLTLAACLGLTIRSHLVSIDMLNKDITTAINECNSNTNQAVVMLFADLASAKLATVRSAVTGLLGSSKKIAYELELTMAAETIDDLQNVSTYMKQLPRLWSALQNELFDVAVMGGQHVGIYIVASPPMMAITDSNQVTTAGTFSAYGRFADAACDINALRSGLPSGPCTVPAVGKNVTAYLEDAFNGSASPHWSSTIGSVSHVSATLYAGIAGNKSMDSPPGAVHAGGLSLSTNFEKIRSLCTSEAGFDSRARLFVMEKDTSMLVAASHEDYTRVEGMELHVGMQVNIDKAVNASLADDEATRKLAMFVMQNFDRIGHTEATVVMVGSVEYLMIANLYAFDSLELVLCFALPSADMHTIVHAPPPPDQNLSTAIWVVAPIISVVVVLALAYGVSVLLEPIHELGHKMEKVSLLHLEGAKHLTCVSPLQEVDSMQASFKAMVDSIEELTAFLPASLMGRIESTDDEAQKVSAPNRSNSNGSKKQSSKQTSNSGADSLKGMMRVKLTQKFKITEAFLGLAAFDRYMKDTCSKDELFDVTDFHSRYIHTVLTEAVNNQGSLVRFHADEAVVDFKGITPCGSSADKAARFALTVATEHNRTWGHPYCKVHIGIGYGTCLVGNMGIEQVKTMTVLGEAYHLSKVMHCVGKEQGHAVVVTKAFSDKVQDIYVSLPIDVVIIDGKPVQAHMLEAKPATESWMYANNSLVVEYHKAWDSVLAGDFNDALSIFRMLTVQKGGPAAVLTTAKKIIPRLLLYRKHVDLVFFNKSPQLSAKQYAKVYSESIMVPASALESQERLTRGMEHENTSIHAHSVHSFDR